MPELEIREFFTIGPDPGVVKWPATIEFGDNGLVILAMGEQRISMALQDQIPWLAEPNAVPRQSIAGFVAQGDRTAGIEPFPSEIAGALLDDEQRFGEIAKVDLTVGTFTFILMVLGAGPTYVTTGEGRKVRFFTDPDGYEVIEVPTDAPVVKNLKPWVQFLFKRCQAVASKAAA